jgi:allantoinase
MPENLERVVLPSSRMDQDWYDFSAFPTRKPIAWPGGARIALWIVPSLEFMDLVPEANAWGLMPSSAAAPNVRNWSHRDYGNRVGIWRIMEVLDRYGLRATAAINAEVCRLYPEIVEASLQRGWEIMAHGELASRMITERMPVDEERALIARSREAISRATGTPPAGWLSPGLSESTRTPGLLAEAGFTYTADWVNDDQPFRMKVSQGRLLAVPYSVDVNDESMIVNHSRTAWEFAQAGKDHFDALYADARAAGTGLVMCVALHAYLIGQPLRIKYLDEILRHMLSYAGVWPATGSEIADYYQSIT